MPCRLGCSCSSAWRCSPLADMTGARQIVAGLESAGVTIAASVPDTWIGKLVEEVRRSSAIRVVDVAREEEAVAVACGANLAGGRGAVLIQNAGLRSEERRVGKECRSRW